jgi:hypothetical protein
MTVVSMVFVLYAPIYTVCADPCVMMKIKICLMFNNVAPRLFSVNGRLMKYEYGDEWKCCPSH